MKELKILIFQALGQASMCWDNIEKAGVFQAEKVQIIGDKLIADILDLIHEGTTKA